MIVLLIVSIFALIFTELEAKNRLKNGMFIAFLLLTIIQAIHYDFGNDYMSYMETYNMIINQSFDWDSIKTGEIWKEPGWALLNYVVVPFGGFFTLVAVLAIIQNIIYYKFIRTYIPKSWWIMAVFIYLFNTSYYVLNMSMLRQGLAISLFVWSFKYIKDRKLIPAFLLLLVAASIHNSAKILLPFIFIGFIPFGKNSARIIAVVSTLLFLFIFFNASLLNSIFMQFLEIEDVQNYADTYQSDSHEVSFGMGFIANMIPFVLSLLYLLKNSISTNVQRELVTLSLISSIVIPFVQIIPLITRISMYFGAFTIVSIPIVYRWISYSIIRNCVVLVYVIMTFYSYYLFFNSSVYEEAYSIYHTIFSTL